MIGRILRFLGLTLVFAVIAHGAAVLLSPSLIMGVAIDRVGANGMAVNQWVWRERVSPAQRDIVQPSPDLAYGACAFDLSRGAVRITVMPGADYVSLSLYADNTDNFFAVNDSAMNGQPLEIALIGPGGRAPAGAAQVVQSPTVRGLALERRLAPTPDAFAAANIARRAGACAPWPEEASPGTDIAR
jgi:uncharacterized membrane protein